MEAPRAQWSCHVKVDGWPSKKGTREDTRGHSVACNGHAR